MCGIEVTTQDRDDIVYSRVTNLIPLVKGTFAPKARVALKDLYDDPDRIRTPT